MLWTHRPQLRWFAGWHLQFIGLQGTCRWKSDRSRFRLGPVEPFVNSLTAWVQHWQEKRMLSCSCSYISIVLDALDYGFEVFVQHAFMILELYSYLYSDTRSRYIYIYILSPLHAVFTILCHPQPATILKFLEASGGRGRSIWRPGPRLCQKRMRVCGSIFPQIRTLWGENGASPWIWQLYAEPVVVHIPYVCCRCHCQGLDVVSFAIYSHQNNHDWSFDLRDPWWSMSCPDLPTKGGCSPIHRFRPVP